MTALLSGVERRTLIGEPINENDPRERARRRSFVPPGVNIRALPCDEAGPDALPVNGEAGEDALALA
jgi:hypothetical protein